MKYPQEYGFFKRTVSLKRIGTAIVVLIFLATVGLIPMSGSIVTHSTVDSAITLVAADSFEEIDDLSGANATCENHIACVAIEATAMAVNSNDFAETKPHLSLHPSVLRAAEPPLLNPPINS
ncbi:MAG: hypothetical protein HRU29_16045 [Rhizobiales bacterium]|nr:hypothetical protein [Hyphomicrobiales bacterium]NRB15906.1 hypothetical protein [Hyphomicrobiales bacterium]